VTTGIARPGTGVNITETLQRLCYSYPSPLVDAVTEHEPGKRMVAVKNVTVNEEFFQGHFPGTPLMPGVLMIESFAQLATLLLMHDSEGAWGDRVFLRGVDNAKFRKSVVPGDRLRLEVTLRDRRARIARAQAAAYVEDTLVAEAQLVMGLVGGAVKVPARPLIDPTAVVHPAARIGLGTRVGPHAPSSMAIRRSAMTTRFFH
jgi:3-hydroxyacyl-[acyl-carrier-protein] dehydratase